MHVGFGIYGWAWEMDMGVKGDSAGRGGKTGFELLLAGRGRIGIDRENCSALHPEESERSEQVIRPDTARWQRGLLPGRGFAGPPLCRVDALLAAVGMHFSDVFVYTCVSAGFGAGLE